MKWTSKANNSATQHPRGSFRVSLFIDCTVIATVRPGGGPIEGGVGAPRCSNYIQMTFYNGWKKHHGIKFQSLETCTGICASLFGPRAFKRSDLMLLNDSDVLRKMRDLQVHKPANAQRCVYGDGIYPADAHILSRGSNITDGMASIRIANEWDYGITANLFPFIKWRAAQKLRLHHDIPQYYFVATLFRNFNCIFYGGVSYSYFCGFVRGESRPPPILPPCHLCMANSKKD
jgi:hypothetical protein